MSHVQKVLIPLENGFEEMEAIAPIDLLRRAEFEVSIAAVGNELSVMSKNSIQLIADSLLANIDITTMDALVIPGGPAVMKLLENENFLQLISEFHKAQKPIAAICAAPFLLNKLEILNDKHYTGHDCIEETMPELLKDHAVVVDGSIITSRGAGTATQFALKLIEIWKGPTHRDEIADSIHWGVK